MNNPHINALAAFVYIVCIAFFLQTIPPLFKPEIAALGVALMLSTLVLSVALMGFLFFFKPACLAIEMRFAESAKFFIKTILTFSILAGALLVSLLFL